MNSHRILLAAVFALPIAVLSVGLYAPDAEACSPMEPFYKMFHAEIVEEDTPEDVETHEFGSLHYYYNDDVMLEITNHSEEELEFQIVDCPTREGSFDSEEYTCLDLVLAPGDTGWLTIETRPASELEHGEVNEQLYSWHLGDEEGLLHTIYEFEHPYEGDDLPDYSGACSGAVWGCSTAGASLPVDMVILLAIALGALGVRRFWTALPEARVQG